jgi:hypothetical protein
MKEKIYNPFEKKQEQLRDEFEKITNDKCFSSSDSIDGLFSDEYVEWLEKQLLKEYERF